MKKLQITSATTFVSAWLIGLVVITLLPPAALSPATPPTRSRPITPHTSTARCSPTC